MARILAVDDDKSILTLINNALRKEHEVTCISEIEDSFGEGLDKYDLILLDVMMPGTDGFTICEKIRSIVDCPILFLTAKGMEDDVEYGFSVGADDYIKKPFSIVELRARINAHLRREKREKIQVYAASGVKFYFLKKQAYYEEQCIQFTKSEYDIALFLAKNHGQTFSKEYIYEKIYGYDKDGNDSAITEHIKNIRKKLDKYNCNPIETVWGIGYRWK